jgi:hypothetical protein
MRWPWQPKEYRLPAETGRVIDIRGRFPWGNHVTITSSNPDDTIHEFYSHMTPRIQVGDIVLLDMNSGKVGRNLILTATYPGDPEDMAMGTLSCIGYTDG